MGPRSRCKRCTPPRAATSIPSTGSIRRRGFWQAGPDTANAWPVVVARLHMHLGPQRTSRPALRRVRWAGAVASSGGVAGGRYRDAPSLRLARGVMPFCVPIRSRPRGVGSATVNEPGSLRRAVAAWASRAARSRRRTGGGYGVGHGVGAAYTARSAAHLSTARGSDPGTETITKFGCSRGEAPFGLSQVGRASCAHVPVWSPWSPSSLGPRPPVAPAQAAARALRPYRRKLIIR